MMSAYEPMPLEVIRPALDHAWALLPEASNSKHLKIDMADRVLRKAAMSEQDLVRLCKAALAGTGMDER
jgi:hypothetical protein